MKRTLAIDYGTKRLGLAVSDALGITAQGIESFFKKSNSEDYEHIRAVCLKKDVGECVVGFPLHLSGREGAQAEQVKLWIEGLKKKLSCPVILWDERLTSKEAQRAMISFGLSRKRQKEESDLVSAVLILQNYLEYGRTLKDQTAENPSNDEI